MCIKIIFGQVVNLWGRRTQHSSLKTPYAQSNLQPGSTGAELDFLFPCSPKQQAEELRLRMSPLPRSRCFWYQHNMNRLQKIWAARTTSGREQTREKHWVFLREKLEAGNCRWGTDAGARTREHCWGGLRHGTSEKKEGRQWLEEPPWCAEVPEGDWAGLRTDIRSTRKSMGWDCHREELEETLEEGAVLKEPGIVMRPRYCRDWNWTRGFSIKLYRIPRRLQSSSASSHMKAFEHFAVWSITITENTYKNLSGHWSLTTKLRYFDANISKSGPPGNKSLIT